MVIAEFDRSAKFEQTMFAGPVIVSVLLFLTRIVP
jgi:hypothetical protein